jgi:hypothetical protein
MIDFKFDYNIQFFCTKKKFNKKVDLLNYHNIDACTYLILNNFNKFHKKKKIII